MAERARKTIIAMPDTREILSLKHMILLMMRTFPNMQRNGTKGRAIKYTLTKKGGFVAKTAISHNRYIDWKTFAALMAGFACYRLYISIYFVANNVMPQPSSTGLGAYDLYSILLVVLVLASAFIKQERFFSSNTVAVLGAACMMLGTILYHVETAVTIWLFAPLAGVGVALLTVQWGLVLSQNDHRVTTLAVIGGFICSAALNSGIGSFDIVYMIISALSGPASCIFLLRARQTAPQRKAIEKNEGTDGKFVGKAAAAFFLFAAASVFCSVPMEFSVIELTDNAQKALPLLRTCATALIAFTALACTLFPRFSVKAIYRLIPLFLTIGGLSLFLQKAMPLIAYLCALVGRLGFQLMFWIFAPRIAQCSKKPTASVFAVEFSMYWLGYTASLLLVRLQWPDKLMASIDTMGSIVAIAIVILMIAYLFIFSENDLRLATETTHIDRSSPSEGPSASNADFLSSIAEEHNLSPRETEVFMLLARGRDSRYIQETLYISAGTVSTHRQRIYKKLNIHTKQELFDLIELREGA